MKKAKKDVPLKGVIYARYSSHAQKDESIEQQVQECTAFAAAKSIPIVAIYEDRAVSGRTDRRANFQRMMKDAERGLFNCVIAWKSNRMGRNMLQAMTNEAKLQALQIQVLYVEEDFDDTAAGRFALRSMMNVNQFYSENMAEDIRRGLYDNAAQCKVTNGKLPFGYTHDADLRYILDPPKAEIVKEIFGRVLSGETFADIATDLNARGIRTGNGGLWNKNSFHVMLRNERYMGIYIYQDVRIPGGIPQIIEEGLFYRMQQFLKGPRIPKGRHRPAGDYLLTGKLFCGHCKSPMVGVSGTSKLGRTYFYYACQAKKRNIICNKQYIRREYIENAVTGAIRRYILRDDVLEWMTEQVREFTRKSKEQTPIGTLQHELAQVQRSISNLLQAIEAGIITETTKGRLLELEKRQAVLDSQIKDQQTLLSQYSRDDVLSSFELYRNGDIENKEYRASLIDIFVIAVYLYADKFQLYFNVTSARNRVDVSISDYLIDEIEYYCSNKFYFGVPSESPLFHPNSGLFITFLLERVCAIPNFVTIS